MADKPISYEKLVNADKDADTLEQVTSADKNTTVVSRLGRQYPSLAKALQTIIDAGGFKPYSTEAELKASVPVIVPSAAYAFDTKKVWLWNGSAWVDEGTSALDQAKEYVKFSYIMKPDLVAENLNDVVTTGVYFQKVTLEATLERNYPVNKAGKLEVFCPNIYGQQFVFQRYSTLDNEDYLRVKYASFAFQAWKKIASSFDISQLEAKTITVKDALATSNLDTITTTGLYRQFDDASATTVNNYPVQQGGNLYVENLSNMIVQDYTTRFGLRFWRVKFGTNAFQAWQEFASKKWVSDNAILIKSNLSNEDLDSISTSGLYRQLSDANATTANHYPDTRAGILEVKNIGGLIIQEYTTWYSKKFWRTKYSSFAFQVWQEVTPVASINMPYKGKNIAWFGDSIVEGNTHPNRIATLLGATVQKFGFSSHMMSKYIDSPLGRDKGSMYRFAKAINTGDWTDVIAGGEWVRDNLSDDNMPQINAMVATDWTKVDYIVIAFGTNDIYSATPLGELTDPADATGATFVGATKYVIEAIQDKYPHIQIMFVSPVFRTRWFQTPNPDRPEQNSDTLLDPQGKKYTDYVDALLHMKNMYHIPVFDFYRTSGINIRTWSNYLSDGVHPKEIGIQLWTKKISAFMIAN